MDRSSRKKIGKLIYSLWQLHVKLEVLSGQFRLLDLVIKISGWARHTSSGVAPRWSRSILTPLPLEVPGGTISSISGTAWTTDARSAAASAQYGRRVPATPSELSKNISFCIDNGIAPWKTIAEQQVCTTQVIRINNIYLEEKIHSYHVTVWESR